MWNTIHNKINAFLGKMINNAVQFELIRIVINRLIRMKYRILNIPHSFGLADSHCITASLFRYKMQINRELRVNSYARNFFSRKGHYANCLQLRRQLFSGVNWTLTHILNSAEKNRKICVYRKKAVLLQSESSKYNNGYYQERLGRQCRG